jgi:hypothetical protein
MIQNLHPTTTGGCAFAVRRQRRKNTRQPLCLCVFHHYARQTALDNNLHGKGSLSCAVYRGARHRGFAMRFAWHMATKSDRRRRMRSR